MLESIFFILFGFIAISLLDNQYKRNTSVGLGFPSIVVLVILYIALLFPLKHILDTEGHSYKLTSLSLTFLSSLILYFFGIFFYVPLQVSKFKKTVSEYAEANRQADEKNSILIKEAIKKALKEREAEKSDTTIAGNKETPENKS